MSYTNEARFALSRSEEDKLVKKCQSEALKLCEKPVGAFTKCAEGRTVTVAWSCRTEFKAMQDCMAIYMTQDRIDDAKMKFLKERNAAAGIA
ncbi:cytochrome c oxidase biogenesis protein Cmc1-like protein [Pseudohyphozyma bogoriensis]|nr:cytochrome c oxidase biogenesis protein Cmc1-like protein [Pseudohyphozyma bogoriensis]